MRQAGDQVDANAPDAGAEDTVDLLPALRACVAATDGGGLLVDEALDAEADAVHPLVLQGGEGVVGELAGGHTRL